MKIPTLLCLLAEGNELFTRGNAEDSMVFVLSTILQLDCTCEPNRADEFREGARQPISKIFDQEKWMDEGVLPSRRRLTRSLPSRQVGPSRRKADFYNIRQIELTKQLCTLC